MRTKLLLSNDWIQQIYEGDFGKTPDSIQFDKTPYLLKSVKERPYYWYFQTNEDLFDIVSYLLQSEIIAWLFKEPPANIKTGDKIFVYRAKGKNKADPGILAHGEIISADAISFDEREKILKKYSEHIKKTESMTEKDATKVERLKGNLATSTFYFIKLDVLNSIPNNAILPKKECFGLPNNSNNYREIGNVTVRIVKEKRVLRDLKNEYRHELYEELKRRWHEHAKQYLSKVINSTQGALHEIGNNSFANNTYNTNSSSKIVDLSVAASRAPVLFEDSNSISINIIVDYNGNKYIRHEVSGDGDCGYTAFGITRRDALKLIIDNISNVREQLIPLIRETLLTKSFIRYLQQNNSNLPVLADFEAYQHAAIQGEEIENSLNNLYQRADDIVVIQAYINYDIRDREIDAGWAHPIILQVLARIQKLRLILWELSNEEKIAPHSHYHDYIPPNVEETLNLVFINGNHFERLEVVESNISESYLLKNDSLLLQKVHSPKLFAQASLEARLDTNNAVDTPSNITLASDSAWKQSLPNDNSTELRQKRLNEIDSDEENFIKHKHIDKKARNEEITDVVTQKDKNDSNQFKTAVLLTVEKDSSLQQQVEMASKATDQPNNKDGLQIVRLFNLQDTSIKYMKTSLKSFDKTTSKSIKKSNQYRKNNFEVERNSLSKREIALIGRRGEDIYYKFLKDNYIKKYAGYTLTEKRLGFKLKNNEKTHKITVNYYNLGLNEEFYSIKDYDFLIKKTTYFDNKKEINEKYIEIKTTLSEKDNELISYFPVREIKKLKECENYKPTETSIIKEKKYRLFAVSGIETKEALIKKIPITYKQIKNSVLRCEVKLTLK